MIRYYLLGSWAATTIAAAVLSVAGQRPREPWVHPGEVGPDGAGTELYAKYGFGIGKGGLPLTLSDHTLSGGDNAITMTMYDGAGGPVRWSNTRIHGFWGNNTKWGTRAYDVWDWEFDNVRWDTIRQEHGCYLSVVGGVRWNQCVFGSENLSEGIAGQAIQVVHSWPGSVRGHETGLGDPRIWTRLFNATRDTERHEVIDSVFLNCARPNTSERGSFVLSFFEPNGKEGPTAHAVTVRGCYASTSDPWTDPNGIERDCGGFLMAHRARQVVLRQSYISFKKGDRDSVQIWGCSDGVDDTVDVLIAENVFDCGQPIDIRLATPGDTVVIGRNKGETQVRVWSDDTPWYQWPPKGGTLLYEGCVNASYRFN